MQLSEDQIKMVKIIEEANSEKTAHIIISSRRGSGKTFVFENIAPKLGLLNKRAMPQCYKYGLLVFDENVLPESEIDYWIERCSSDLISGLVIFCSDVPIIDNFNKINLHRI